MSAAYDAGFADKLSSLRLNQEMPLVMVCSDEALAEYRAGCESAERAYVLETTLKSGAPLMYDATFDAWRSCKTGHRVINGDGSPVSQTRELARRKPWLAGFELYHRWLAKRGNGK